MPPSSALHRIRRVLPGLAAAFVFQLAVQARQEGRPHAEHAARADRDSQLDARRLLDGCNRLVLARVARVHTFDAPPQDGARAGNAPKAEGAAAPLRYAELTVLDAPFGSMDERIVVRLAAEVKEPSGVLVWPLGPNLRFADEDWKHLDELERTKIPARVFGLAYGEPGPWPVRAAEGGDVVDLPARFVAGTTANESAKRSSATSEPTVAFQLASLTRAVRDELARSTPRVEARIHTNGPSSWRAVVERDELVLTHAAAHPAWSATERERWRALWSALEFDTLPARVGNSRGPDEALYVLAHVTERGRETVRAQWMGPAPSEPGERAAVERVRTFWDGFRALVAP